MDRAATQKGKTMLVGHALCAEGAPYMPNGERGDALGVYWGTSGPGHAKCECGALSPVLPSGSARRRWHREHKDALR